MWNAPLTVTLSRLGVFLSHLFNRQSVSVVTKLRFKVKLGLGTRQKLVLENPMKKCLYISTLLLGLAACLPLSVLGQQGRAVNSLGQVVFAPPGGGAATDSLGRVITGVGGCTKNSLGRVVCADTPGGGAMANSLGQVQTGPGQCVRNSLGQALCAGGCVSGR
jgi:hypothetical protein